ncbi:hypothetical protein [Roseibacillus ishigakijimensis]|uniref:hypothetical protein n=1 Tax=Roseibacillus ishigakijimensis TaxID=454146 RepID=UPI001905779A|nr:hypothetical protein [Roseibacillus ishigakijimensis]
MNKVTTLYRPIGEREHLLLKKCGFRKWPPRLPEQPIFYPVTNEDYAVQIARDWNTKDSTNGNVGFVTRFDISSKYLSRFEKQTVGGRLHAEYWIPAEDLDEFNEHIVGQIEVIRKFTPEGEVPAPRK